MHVKEDQDSSYSLSFQKKEQHVEIYSVIYAGAMGTWNCSEWDVFSSVGNLSKGWKANLKLSDIF